MGSKNTNYTIAIFAIAPLLFRSIKMYSLILSILLFMLPSGTKDPEDLKNKIPAKLPKNVKLAQKTGWITGVNHDAGIVILPEGRKYVLVMLSKELENDKAAIKSMAKVSKMIYKYFLNQR